ncbi:hypothetical protein GOV11_05135 [Candidatus Woesearchaeota archaeon]|nr:hypothetical protein [Candidatus Woesearchaeota archaeon]
MNIDKLWTRWKSYILEIENAHERLKDTEAPGWTCLVPPMYRLLMEEPSLRKDVDPHTVTMAGHYLLHRYPDLKSCLEPTDQERLKDDISRFFEEADDERG